MIRHKTIKDINDKTMEGKLLLAALVVLTQVNKQDISEGIYGGMSHPDDVLRRIVELSNKMYYEEELKIEKKIEKRDRVIDSILKN